MNRFALSAVVLCAAGGAAHGTLLQNGDLELPLDAPSESDLIDAWTLEEPGGVNSATTATFANHTPGGDRGLWLRPWDGGSSQPAPVSATLFQDVPALPGVDYSLSGWFNYEANYSGLDPAVGTMTLLAIDFLDAASMVISSSVLDVDTVAIGDSVWRRYEVMGLSPAGTVSVRARVSMIDGVFADANPQSAFVDDLELVPAPGAAVALGVLGAVGLRRRR